MKKPVFIAAALLIAGAICSAGCNGGSKPAADEEQTKIARETPPSDGVNPRDRMPYRKPNYDFIIPRVPRGGREKGGAR